jgi:electron transfer flavoprotein beta subunit
MSATHSVACKAVLRGVEEVIVLGAGGEQIDETLRHGLAMGADRAVRVVCDNVQPHEELLLARRCAAAIGRLTSGDASFLVLCGARSTDNGAGEFGPALAEYLNLPHAGAVARLETGDGGLRVHSRNVAGCEQVIDVQLPAVITAERGLIEPRHPALPKLMKAKKQTVEVLELDDCDADANGSANVSLLRLTPPKARQTCRFIQGDAREIAAELVRVLREEAKVL